MGLPKKIHHLENVITNIYAKNKLQIPVSNLNKIYMVFGEIVKILPQMNSNRKRMISINFILKQLFKMLNLPHDCIIVPRSKTTLAIYQQY